MGERLIHWRAWCKAIENVRRGRQEDGVLHADRATAMAVYFLSHAKGHLLNDLKLMKLLYISDREALRVFGDSISGSSFCSLPKGPVLSEVLNWWMGSSRAPEVWDGHIEFIHVESGLHPENKLRLRKSMVVEEVLSGAELGILANVWVKHRQDHKWQLVELTHDYKEWDPRAHEQSTSYPIRLEDIFIKGFNDPPEVAHEKAADTQYYGRLSE